jgi:hypothetical protein
MNHWDLRPGETVTLERVRDLRRIRTQFLYRDTCCILFAHTIGDKTERLTFRLCGDGSFVERVHFAGGHKYRNGAAAEHLYFQDAWRIADQRPDTRGRWDPLQRAAGV